MTLSLTTEQAYYAALSYYNDCGVEHVVEEDTIDRTQFVGMPIVAPVSASAVERPTAQPAPTEQTSFLGKSDAYAESKKLAQSVDTLDALRDVIRDFDGIALKKTATQMVFADGNPQADVMLVGEAPGADEDRQGKPFVGVSGQLLDLIVQCIGLDRKAAAAENALYISNILNWRPPGNRTPSPAEIEVSLPFIERHIQLVKPKVLILCGGVAAKALLGRSEAISRLRKTWHNYTPQTDGVGDYECMALATYHPSYLLRTPVQKRLVWADMIVVQKYLQQNR